MSNKKTRKKSKILRWIILGAILVFTTLTGIMHQYVQVNKPGGVDAFCPFGGLESLLTLITSGTMLQKIEISTFILLAAVIISAIIFKRSFCGNLCPFGALQELSARLGKLIFKKRFTLPQKVDKIVRYLKYVILLLLVFFSFRMADLIIRPYDPWAAFHHLTSGELFTEFLIGFIVLVISLVGSAFYDRFFCKYLCPMGAFTGIVGKISLFKVKREASSCIDCKACDKACPVNIKVSELNEVKSAECINCSECVNACPVKDTLKIQGPAKKKIDPKVLVLATLLIFVLVVGITSLTGDFKYFKGTLTEEISKSGHFDVEMLRGYMTFSEIAQASGIPQEKFRERFAITEEEIAKPVKDVKGLYGFTMEDVKAFVEEELK